MIYNLYKKHKFEWLLLQNTLFFVLAAFLLPIRFQDNDDSLMCLIASGNYSGSPDAHLVFINYIYGLILKLFYVFVPGIEWYTLFFCLMHIVSLSVITYKIITNNNERIIRFMFVFLFYVIETVIIQSFQFTTTAAILALAGFLLIFDQKKWVAVFGVLFILLGSLIRFEAVMLITIIALPMYIKKLINIRSLLLFVICLAAVVAFNLIDREIYNQDRNWRSYIEYNELRGKINDNPNAISLRDNFSMNEININDYKLLLKYFPDGNILNSHSLKQINEKLGLAQFDEKILNSKQILSYLPFIVIILSLFLITGFSQTTTLNRFIVTAGAILFLSIIVGISMNASLKFRVFITAILPLFFLLQYYFISQRPHIRKLFVLTLSLFIMSLLYVVVTKKINKNSEINKVYSMQLPLLERNKGVNVVPFADHFRIENTNPFKLHSLQNSLVFGGWLTNIPFNAQKFDSFKSFVDRKLLLFVSRKKSDQFIQMIQTSIDNNYGIKTSVSVIDMNDEYLLILFRRI